MVNTPSGVKNQIISEDVAAKEAGLDLDTRIISPAPDPYPLFIRLSAPSNQSRVLRWRSIRKNYAKWLVEQQHSYDAILARWVQSDPYFASALKEIRCPVFTVHHTIEPLELELNEKFGTIRKNLDMLFFKAASKSITGIIGVTDEILDYEAGRSKRSLPGFVYPNGIYLEDSLKVPGKIGESSVPEIIFVASAFTAWHGLNRLLQSVLSSDAEFTLHVVGTVFKEDLEIGREDKRIIFHGPLKSEALDSLYKRCGLGLTSFSLEDKGLTQACTLKCREYLKNGLLVYSGHKEVLPSTFPYYRQGLPNVEHILNFYEENKGIEKLEIAKAAKPYIDKRILLQGLYDWIGETIGKK